MSEAVDQDELQIKDESNVEWAMAWRLCVLNKTRLVEIEK